MGTYLAGQPVETPKNDPSYCGGFRRVDRAAEGADPYLDLHDLRLARIAGKSLET